MVLFIPSKNGNQVRNSEEALRGRREAFWEGRRVCGRGDTKEGAEEGIEVEGCGEVAGGNDL